MKNEKPEASVIDVCSFRLGELDLMPNIHKHYTLYYDETNNIRRLALTDTGLNHDALDCFVLGGIALEPGAELPRGFYSHSSPYGPSRVTRGFPQ